MADLQRLVYYSRNTITGGDAAVTASIQQILQSARRNNPPVGVTGALMFNGGCFAQVLEGPARAVAGVFERIQRDFRHSDVTVLDCSFVDGRTFPHWSMAFVGEHARNSETFAKIGAESGFDAQHLQAEAILANLHQLVREEELDA